MRTIHRSIKLHKLLGSDKASEIGIVGVSSWEKSVTRMTSSTGTGVLLSVIKRDDDTKELVSSAEDLVLYTARQGEWLKHVRSYSGSISQLLLRETASITLEGGRKVAMYNQDNEGELKLYVVQPRSARGIFMGLELSLTWLCASLLSGGTREEFKELKVGARVAKRFLVYTEKPYALMRGYFRVFTPDEQVYITGRRQAHWMQGSEGDGDDNIHVFGRQLKAKNKSYFYIFHHILEEEVPVGQEHEHEVIIDDMIHFDGCEIRQDKHGNILMSMLRYIERLRTIELSSTRRKQRMDTATEGETTQYRSLAATLMFLGNAVLPQASYATSVLEQMIAKLRVEELVIANDMLKELLSLKPHIVFKVPPPVDDIQEVIVSSFSDASFNHTDATGYGQTGLVTGLRIKRKTGLDLFHPPPPPTGPAPNSRE